MKKKTITYSGGHTLSYAESGDTNGYPVLIQHGLIASINDQHLFDRLAEAGARVISIARPGYGESSPYEMKNVAEWADIVGVLVKELVLSGFDVLGISSGAPYSYAIGWRFPERVRNVFILSGIPALYDDRVLASWPYPVNRNATIAEMQALARELFFSHLAQEELDRDDIKDSMMNDCFGPALDLKIRCMDWGFQLSDVKPAVTMQHSRGDNLATAELTARLLPDCRLEIREDDQHFSQEILDDFISSAMAGFYRRVDSIRSR